MKGFIKTIGACALLWTGAAQAQTLVVDRGLPTANLNNAAGSNRSNVAWSDPGVFYGDTFTLGGAAGTNYTITSMQTWVVARDGAPTAATLYTGRGTGTNLTATSSAATFNLVTYANGSTYQAQDGTNRLLYSVTFSGLNIAATAGSTLSFGVNGTQQGGYLFFNHASNAALSGSTQAGADNVMSEYNSDGTYVGPYNSNGDGWDKSSDINVRVFATVGAAGAVPEPATWGMMILGMGAVGHAMRRRAKVVARVSVAG